MLNQKQIQEALEKNQAIIKSFGVRKLDLLKNTGNVTKPVGFQVEFKDMSLDIYENFKGFLEKIVDSDVTLTLKNPTVIR